MYGLSFKVSEVFPMQYIKILLWNLKIYGFKGVSNSNINTTQHKVHKCKIWPDMTQ